jgi:hypothetical protein
LLPTGESLGGLDAFGETDLHALRLVGAAGLARQTNLRNLAEELAVRGTSAQMPTPLVLAVPTQMATPMLSSGEMTALAPWLSVSFEHSDSCHPFVLL